MRLNPNEGSLLALHLSKIWQYEWGTIQKDERVAFLISEKMLKGIAAFFGLFKSVGGPEADETPVVQPAALREILFFNLAENAHDSLRRSVSWCLPGAGVPDNPYMNRISWELELTKNHAAETELMVQAMPVIPEDHSLARVLPEYARLLELLREAIDRISESACTTDRFPSRDTHTLAFAHISARLCEDESPWLLRRQLRRCQKRVLRKLEMCAKGLDDEQLTRRLSNLSDRTCVEPEPDARRSTESLESLNRQMRVTGMELRENDKIGVWRAGLTSDRYEELALILERRLFPDETSQSHTA